MKAPATELDAVKKAMDMENKTYDFYKSQGEKANYDAEREFYEGLASEEREHHMILLDYYEYLKDPASWFVVKSPCGCSRKIPSTPPGKNTYLSLKKPPTDLLLR